MSSSSLCPLYYFYYVVLFLGHSFYLFILFIFHYVPTVSFNLYDNIRPQVFGFQFPSHVMGIFHYLFITLSPTSKLCCMVLPVKTVDLLFMVPVYVFGSLSMNVVLGGRYCLDCLYTLSTFSSIWTSVPCLPCPSF